MQFGMDHRPGRVRGAAEPWQERAVRRFVEVHPEALQHGPCRASAEFRGDPGGRVAGQVVAGLRAPGIRTVHNGPPAELVVGGGRGVVAVVDDRGELAQRVVAVAGPDHRLAGGRVELLDRGLTP
jgi:hypothetical protein